jgi:hypothetical protein
MGEQGNRPNKFVQRQKWRICQFSENATVRSKMQLSPPTTTPTLTERFARSSLKVLLTQARCCVVVFLFLVLVQSTDTKTGEAPHQVWCS